MYINSFNLNTSIENQKNIKQESNEFLINASMTILNHLVSLNSYNESMEQLLKSNDNEKLLKLKIKTDFPNQYQRLIDEFFGYGPLDQLFNNKDITEILVNGPHDIWYESGGTLIEYNDQFLTDWSYQRFIDSICSDMQLYPTFETPCINGKWKNFRVTIVHQQVTQSSIHISFRRHNESPWTFNQLVSKGWCNSQQAEILYHIVSNNKNILIAGTTGAGKTTVLNALIHLIKPNERIITIEDTPELKTFSKSNMSLFCRQEIKGVYQKIDQQDLVRYSLRLRPDRIIMGEIRQEEAKDFILALSTGHSGSMATIHSDNPHQALMRLEILVQLGAPHWSLSTIRKMMKSSLDYIICCKKDSKGHRYLDGIFKITSLEETGFLLEQIQSLEQL